MAALLTAGLTLWTVRRTRRAIRHWFDRAVLRAVHQFRVRLDRYKLVSRRAIREELLHDAVVKQAMDAHAAEHHMEERAVRTSVERYISEIVPQFNVLSYYKFGYNFARVFINLLYRVESDYVDRQAIHSIPRTDVVVYLV
ncbi:MAG: hypothetical protein OER89_14480, partial [Gemmatimonadota bacterium]|nr:hypothetical protein [Gemmatimonadota bacterium]